MDEGDNLDGAGEEVASALSIFRDNTTPKDRREKTREKVTLIVVKAYCTSVILLIVGGLYLVYFCSRDTTTISSLGDMLQKLFLPIMTLVLGFYYGTKEDSE